ncbi:hypothetical protein Drorol1_Dr00000918, partial [Drosera rotundifolia]
MARSFKGTDSQAMTLTVVEPKKFWNDFHFRVQWVQGTSAGIYQYFVKIVPTVYTNVRGYTIYSDQSILEVRNLVIMFQEFSSFTIFLQL